MAKRFKFRLETLLKVRTLREQEAKRRVAAKQAEIVRLDRADHEAEHEIRRQQADLLGAQRPGVLDPAALQRGRAWIAHLRKTMTLRDVERRKLQQELAKLQDAWRAARTEMRVIEKLRERQRNDFDRRQGRREQAETEELAQQLHVFNSDAHG